MSSKWSRKKERKRFGVWTMCQCLIWNLSFSLRILFNVAYFVKKRVQNNYYNPLKKSRPAIFHLTSLIFHGPHLRFSVGLNFHTLPNLTNYKIILLENIFMQKKPKCNAKIKEKERKPKNKTEQME